MFKDFAHRHTSCTVDGVSEKVVLSRETRGTGILDKEYRFNGLFDQESDVALGSVMIVANDVFFVQSKRDTVEGDKYCSLIKTNVKIEVQRYSQAYDANDNPDGEPGFDVVASDVAGYAQYVTGKLRQEEPGLLSTTSYTLVLQSSVDVRSPQDDSLISPDRIILDGRSFQVDMIDHIKFPGLMFVQLSEDVR